MSRSRVGLLLPWVLAAVAAGFVYLRNDPYWIAVAMLIVIYAIAASGLSVFVSYAGQFSLGHGALIGIGAYGSAILAIRASVPPPLSVVCGVVFAALLGLLIGLPTVRLTGYYLAIATYGLGVVLYVIFQEGGSLTGGSQGMTGIPRLILFGLDLSNPRTGFLAAAIALFICMGLLALIVSSNYGRGLRTLSESEASASAMGVNVNRVKLQVFVFSSAVAGLAGGIYAYSLRYLDPTAFSPAVSIWLLIMIALGGVGTLWGPALGAVLFVGLRELLKSILPTIVPEAGTRVEVLFFGIVLILVLLFPPHRWFSRLADWHPWRALARRRRNDVVEA